MNQTSPQARPSPSVWSIAGPSIAVFMMGTLTGVIIIKIVAALGTPAVAAVTAGQRINFVSLALLMGMGAATTALVARAWGAQNYDLATAYARLSLKVGLLACVLLSLLAIVLAEPLTHFFQLEGESFELAVTYIRWLSLFGVAQGTMMILSTASRAIGDAKTPLYLGIITNSVSVAAAYALTFGHWGLPALGIKGTALGWGLSLCVGTGIYLFLWLRGHLPLAFAYRGPAPETRLKRFIKICTPATIEQLIMQSAMLLFVGFVASYGTAAFAAYGIGINLFAVTMVIGLGFSMAASALVGQALGAGNRQMALDNVRQALKLSVGILLVSGIISVVFATPLANAMVEDPEVARITAQFLLVLGLLQPLLGMDFVLSGAMRGAGDTRFPLIAGITTILGVRLPLAALVTWQGLPVAWLFAVFIADHLVKALLITHRYRQGRWLRVLEDD